LEQSDSLYAFLKKAIGLVSNPSFLRMEDRFYCEGTASVMSYPEFKDITKARSFLKLLEDRKEILDLFNEDMENDGIKVHIGRENVCKYIQDCAVVTCNYEIKDNIVGALGAIGPTRMEYGKVISTVKYISEVLGKVLDALG
jgi:heat-inducible transcriptional repressor